MRLWIEVENGKRVECEEIKTVNGQDSILVFETAKKLTKSCICLLYTSGKGASDAEACQRKPGK